ncbi:MAG: methylenetetrahydrofolate--tRNA-(uracil(54)-C(5))-methyltransferase (FADH(2)-oxidizing) TrmFO [Deltaproteobacteria bacterium]|nr:methylenetetrahydrofolate--tRNA-(uracil(54)-C(5))-methyltransferase (FADH(2)-oxidizing) TrmFO [Candidatus Anaeroferrophillacea bacterium]
MTLINPVTIIGGGLAGCEASWQLAGRGIPVLLREMKPGRFSPAHEDPHLAELVCSNSLRAADPHHAAGLLKDEMARCGSLIITAAHKTRVPAGGALAVDRHAFARQVTGRIESHPLITVIRREVTGVPAAGDIIIASGPLTADALAADLARVTGPGLHFYDAIAPIVAADSIDRERCFRADRYGEPGTGDYLNCPLSAAEYHRLVELIAAGDAQRPRAFEDEKVFEGCMPVEAMAARGPETLAFGPLKPVGLTDPATGRRPHAVVQLRAENRDATMYNLVGFQTRLTFPWQNQVIHAIPGLEQAVILRYGTMHRNTFIDAPRLVNRGFQLLSDPRIFFAGQISGVEGYVESAASGLVAGIQLACRRLTGQLLPPPATTALGALGSHVTNTDASPFQPMNINFGLFPPLSGGKMKKAARKAAHVSRAHTALEDWLVSLPSVITTSS